MSFLIILLLVNIPSSHLAELVTSSSLIAANATTLFAYGDNTFNTTIIDMKHDDNCTTAIPSTYSPEPSYLRGVNESCPSSSDWPRIEFFLPMHLSSHAAERNDEWKNILMRGLLLFWPVRVSNITLRIMLNEELRNESKLVDEHINGYVATMQNLLRDDFPRVEITYHKHVYLNRSDVPVNNVTLYKTGHDRQQYMMFYADDFVSSEYVAFVDTDTFFHSYVDLHDLFERGKPIIHGTIKRYRKYGPDIVRKKWADSTHSFLGDEEPMICMSYFPLIFRTKDLHHLREFVQKKFSIPFDEMFYNVNRGSLFQLQNF